MKPIAEMTDRELGAYYNQQKNRQNCFDISTEMAARLSAHPAQRIADLTGCVVTRDDIFNQWGMWNVGCLPVNDKWEGCWTDGDVSAHIHISDLPDDNRPWQESIYKPKSNV